MKKKIISINQNAIFNLLLQYLNIKIMNQQRLKDRAENRRHFKILERKLDLYSKTILARLNGLEHVGKELDVVDENKHS